MSRIFYAALLSLALWCVGSASAQTPKIDNYRPSVPSGETFLKEVAEAVKELASAIKGFGTVHVEFSVGNNIVAVVGIACLTTIIVAAIIWPKRRATDAAY